MFTLEINKKIYSVTSIIFSILTIITAILFFANYISIDIVMLLLGFTQLFGGLNQIKMSQQLNSKGISKGDKTVGILSIILGSFILFGVIIKLIL